MADVSLKARRATTRCNVCTFANKRTKIVGKHQINSNSMQMSFNNRLRFNLISFSFNLMLFLSFCPKTFCLYVAPIMSFCPNHYIKMWIQIRSATMCVLIFSKNRNVLPKHVSISDFYLYFCHVFRNFVWHLMWPKSIEISCMT